MCDFEERNIACRLLHRTVINHQDTPHIVFISPQGNSSIRLRKFACYRALAISPCTPFSYTAAGSDFSSLFFFSFSSSFISVWLMTRGLREQKNLFLFHSCFSIITLHVKGTLIHFRRAFKHTFIRIFVPCCGNMHVYIR